MVWWLGGWAAEWLGGYPLIVPWLATGLAGISGSDLLGPCSTDFTINFCIGFREALFSLFNQLLQVVASILALFCIMFHTSCVSFLGIDFRMDFL